ncbi:MAG: hypothetical protein AAF694_23055 [Bacteroidota bacterium]
MIGEHLKGISCHRIKLGKLGAWLILFPLLSLAQAQQPPQLLTEEQQLRSRFIEACTEYMREAYEKAETIFLEILEKDPENAPSHFYLGKIYQKRRNFSQAVVSTKKARQFDPNTQLYQVALRNIYQETGAIEEAIAVQEKIVEKYPEDLKQQLLSLSLLKEAGRWQDAQGRLAYIEGNFDTGILLDEVRNEIFQALGKDESGSLVKGKAKGRKETEPSASTGSVRERFDSYLSEGKKQEALQAVEELLNQNPTDTQGRWLLATYYLTQLDEIDSTKFSAAILPIFSTNEIPIATKLALIERMKPGKATSLKPTQTAQLIEAMVQSHAGEEGMTQIKGDMYFSNQQYDSAFVEYKSIVADDPAKVVIWERLLESAERSEKYEQVYVEAEEAMLYFPNSSSFLTFYALGSVRTQKWDQALYALQKIERLPNVPQDLLAKSKREWAYMDFSKGEYTTALEKISAAQALYPTAWGYELSGDILSKLGREKEARAQWELAIKNGAKSLNIQEKLAQ